ncbi:G protein-coupled receptor 89 [Athelia psychrophila]|uniref:G protein-coupled receptor 89 n=1 Tax=Athelia psychrophila TaxID=1759441 RepID=A0A166VXW9_9AGAM|nr:G protein-coupled receptor 89 [Fibularhizoctonia sp. CBS 109695]
MMSSQAILEILAACVLRTGLFFSCRKFLIRSLYHDLQDLSTTEAPSSHLDVDLELEMLPTAATQSGKPISATLGGKTPLHLVLSRSLFSASFSESCMMLLMLMFQGIDLFRPRARLFNWEVSLFVLLAIILLFIPISLSVVLTMGPSHPDKSRKRSIVTRAAIITTPVALYLFLLSRIPLPESLASTGFTAMTLSRLVFVGIVILGLLSGFGAVSNAWAFFPLFMRHRAITTEGELSTSQQSLARIREDLYSRRAAMERETKSKPQAESTWYSRVVPTFTTSELSQELQGLEALENNMARNVEALQERRDNAKFAGTLKGRVFNWGGQLFAVYCVFRVISSTLNVLIPSRSQGASRNYPDLITHLLAYLLSLVPAITMSLDDVAVISRQISLALVGVIILSSMRMLLRGVTRALRVTSRNLGASLMLLLLAQLMGIYLLSTIVQLRTSFPPPATRPDLEPAEVNLFSTIPEYELFGSLFDVSFLVAAGLSAVVRWTGERVNGLRSGV